MIRVVIYTASGGVPYGAICETLEGYLNEIEEEGGIIMQVVSHSPGPGETTYTIIYRERKKE